MDFQESFQATATDHFNYYYNNAITTTPPLLYIVVPLAQPPHDGVDFKVECRTFDIKQMNDKTRRDGD